MKKSKGENGYIDSHKKAYFKISILLSVFVLVIYFTGNYIVPKVSYYFTVMAALLALPTAHYLTQYVSFSRYKSSSQVYYEHYKAVSDQLLVLSDMIVIRGKKTFYFDALILTDCLIVACYKPKMVKDSNKRNKLKEGEQFLKDILVPKDYTVEVVVMDEEETLHKYLEQEVKGTLNQLDLDTQDKIATILLQNSI